MKYTGMNLNKMYVIYYPLDGIILLFSSFHNKKSIKIVSLIYLTSLDDTFGSLKIRKIRNIQDI